MSLIWKVISFICFAIITNGFKPHNLRPIQKRIFASTQQNDASLTDTKTIIDYWRKGYFSVKEEKCCIISEDSETNKLHKIPNDLEGTYYRNGHSNFNVGNDKIIHPFDGDGMITAVSFRNGSILFRNKFVRTKGYVKEKKSRKISYRNVFGSQRSGGFLSNIFDTKLKNVANTNIIYWGTRLLALWEGGLPYRLETDSLGTIGEYTFRGLLKSNSLFSAHPRIDSDKGRLINFSATRGLSKTSITVYEFEKDSSISSSRTFDIPGFPFFHDFAITKNYYIFNQAPIDFAPIPFVFGFSGPAQCLKFDKSKTSNIYLVPRDNNLPIQIVSVENHFNFHFANAFEDSDGNIVYDIVWADNLELGTNNLIENKPIWEDFDYAREVPFHKLIRCKLSKSEEGWKFSKSKLTNRYLDFPSVNRVVSGKEHRFIFATAAKSLTTSSPLSGIIKIDTKENVEETWFGEVYEFIGEVVIANKMCTVEHPIHGEDDVYLISLLLNTKNQTSELVVFDGLNISQGPISRILLPVSIPFGLHGNFYSELLFDHEDVIRKWKASQAIESKSWNQMTGGFSGLGISYGD